MDISGKADKVFLSTPSARRATFVPIVGLAVRVQISIHALREEGDITSA